MKSNRSCLRSILLVALALAAPFSAWAKTDDVDLPFVDDPAVIGRWQNLATVRSPAGFSLEDRPARSELFIKELVFLPQGKVGGSPQTWTKGVLIDSAGKTASKYSFRKIDGLECLVLEWKNGDYVLRDMPPSYHILVREADYAKLPKPSPFIDNAKDCLVAVSSGGLCRHPSAAAIPRKPMTALPPHDPDSKEAWNVDLRGQDVSKLDLKGRAQDLMHADFDSQTLFPEVLPQGFVPDRIMELGKNPGLGLRGLHKEGITGKGVSMAIIDQSLLVDHAEYGARLRSYEEVHWEDPNASMHAGGVSSIAVGKDCGVAPEADVYFVANWFMERRAVNYAHIAKAIDQVLTINAALAKGKKIRVLTIARGFNPRDKGYAEVTSAVERAKKAGIFVISSSLVNHYGFSFNGLGREPLSDPDDTASYSLGQFWQGYYLSTGLGISTATLLVPMDSRTTASQAGVSDYVFYREGGWSWAIPYIGGLYALACQVNPDITPDVFWKKALETGDSLTLKKDGKEFRLERIVNPRKLLMSLK